MPFIEFKTDGDNIIINSDKIVSVTIDPNSKKPFIQTENHFFTVNESMDDVKELLRLDIKTVKEKKSHLEGLSGRI